ncbi:hypothetical protein ACFE04_023898 [Oxalis oulophora]
MACTFTPPNSIFEFHGLTYMQEFSKRGELKHGLGPDIIAKGVLFGSRRKKSSMYCRAFRSTVLDNAKEVNQSSSKRVALGVNGRFKDQKHPDSKMLSNDGPFVENDELTNNKILQSFCNKGKVAGAANLVDIMGRRNQIPHFPSCINLIRGLINIDRMDKAEKVLNILVMSGGIPDVITYNMMIGAYCRKRMLKTAVDLLENMSLSGCSPDVITYNTVIRCMFENGKFEEAVEFWKHQLRKGCPPYLITYTVLIELVCKYCGTAQAVEVLEDMAEEGCYPDLVIYNSLFNFPCKQGRYEDAALVLYTIISHGVEPNIVTYNTLLSSLCYYGHWDKVTEILEIMDQTSQHPTGKMEKAAEFYRQMVESGIVPDGITHRSLIWGFCQFSQAEKAVGILKEMAKEGFIINIGIYKSVVHGLCKNNNVELAIEVLHMMIKTRCKPDEAIYSTIIKGVADAGMMEEANTLCEKLIEWKVLRETTMMS